MPSTIIHKFLIAQYEKKTETEQKQLAKAKENGDSERFAELESKLSEIRDKFRPNTWLAEATSKMAKQLHFGTHISKGIHPDAKGDNISFKPKHELPSHIIGTHSIESTVLDANGNAAALPLAAFFDFSLDDGIKIRDLILNDDADFIASLAPHAYTARDYHRIFKDALQNVIESPVTHERNKQMLWATNPYSAERVDELNYISVIPLYPSVFTHEIYHSVQAIRYSEKNKTARDNRFKKTAVQEEYLSMPDMATVTLGGTKPQNVSQLMSRQGGRNYLLPSMPPIIDHDYDFHVSKFANSVFNERLAYYARNEIQDIFSVVKSFKNTVDIRDVRKAALDATLHILFAFSSKMQNMPEGWSINYHLDPTEKFWLDPKREELPDEQDFKEERACSDFRAIIIKKFAIWINTLLKAEFPKKKYDFGDPEHNEWEREIEDMIKQYERLGKGVFL